MKRSSRALVVCSSVIARSSTGWADDAQGLGASRLAPRVEQAEHISDTRRSERLGKETDPPGNREPELVCARDEGPPHVLLDGDTREQPLGLG